MGDKGKKTNIERDKPKVEKINQKKEIESRYEQISSTSHTPNQNSDLPNLPKVKPSNKLPNDDTNQQNNKLTNDDTNQHNNKQPNDDTNQKNNKPTNDDINQQNNKTTKK